MVKLSQPKLSIKAMKADEISFGLGWRLIE